MRRGKRAFGPLACKKTLKVFHFFFFYGYGLIGPLAIEFVILGQSMVGRKKSFFNIPDFEFVRTF